MNKSLQDQLLKAGLVDQKKVKAVKQEQRKQKKQQPKGQQTVDETKLAAEQALKEKTARDRELNRQRQQEAEQKALKAQVRQLIETNALTTQGGETPYQFADQNKVKKIWVTPQQAEHLARGLLAVARLGDHYRVIPKQVAEKILQRDAEAIVALHEKSADTSKEEDDFYADFKIPDDLMW